MDTGKKKKKPWQKISHAMWDSVIIFQDSENNHFPRFSQDHEAKKETNFTALMSK